MMVQALKMFFVCLHTGHLILGSDKCIGRTHQVKQTGQRRRVQETAGVANKGGLLR